MEPKIPTSKIDVQRLFEALKGRLSIELEPYYNYNGSHKLTVRLLFDGQSLSDDCCNLSSWGS